MVCDMLLAEVDTPDESTGPADSYETAARIPGSALFLSAAESGCAFTAKTDRLSPSARPGALRVSLPKGGVDPCT